MDYYIEKHGKDKGPELFKERMDRFMKSCLGRSRSNVQIEFKENILDELFNNIECEFSYDESNIKLRIDFLLVDYDIIIEFYGDYWHANPQVVNEGEIHKTLKVPVEEIWEKDERTVNRLNKLGYNVIVVWEQTYREAIRNKSIDELQNKILGYVNDNSDLKPRFIEI